MKDDDKAIAQYREKRRQAAADSARETIKTKELLQRLQCFALDEGVEQESVGKGGKKKKHTNTPKLDNAKIKAIEILLDKSVPNLAAVKHDVEVSNMTFVISTEHKKK